MGTGCNCSAHSGVYGMIQDLTMIIEACHPYIAVLVLIIVGSNVGYHFAVQNELEIIRKQAIARELAYYDRKTGKFTWMVDKPIED